MQQIIFRGIPFIDALATLSKLAFNDLPLLVVPYLQFVL